jgi:hypothetical protein
MNFGAVIGIAAIIGLLVGLILLMNYLDKKRTEAVHAFAQAHGYTVDPDFGGFLASLQAFKLFNLGRSRRLKNLIRTNRGDLSISLADYTYVTGSGKNQNTHIQTVCAVQTSGSRLPHFFLRRQVALFDALGKLFGGQDINFVEDPAFSKAYVLQSMEGENEARRLFQDPVRQAFTALAGKNLQCEGREGTLLLHFGTRLKPERLAELADDAVKLRHVL